MSERKMKASSFSLVKPWRLLAFTALGFVFLWLIYSQLSSLSDAMRWRGFLAAGGVRVVFTSLLFLVLAFGSLVGPVAYVARVIKERSPSSRH